MNTFLATPERFELLLAAAMENRLTPAQYEEWNTLLQENPDARWHFLQRAAFHGTLHQRFSIAADTRDANPQTDPSDLQPALASLFERMAADERAANSQRISPRFLLPSIAWKIAASLLLIALLILAVPHANTPAPAPAPSDSSATITGLINVLWEDPALNLRPGQCLPSHPLHLKAGLVRIELPTGTAIIVQGPAQFELVGPANFHLLRGNLTAHVPHSGVGFTVSTANAAITDLGTEFGVYVNRDDETHTEVFVGKVRVNATTDSGATTSQILEAGHAARIIDPSSGVQNDILEPLVFVRPAEFDAIHADPAAFPFARWLACSNQMRQDPDLVAYYNFEPAASSQILPNLAQSTAGQSDARIDHAAWDDGRLPGKHALRFDGASSLQIDVPAPYPTLTMTAWVNAENIADLRQYHLERRTSAFAGILLSDGARESAFHWQLMDGVRTELGIGVSSEASVLFDRFRSLDVVTPSEQNRWMFLTVVIDPESRKLRHYLDGALIGTNSLNPQVPVPIIGHAEIGNWNPLHRTDHPLRGFKGRIDEFAIFKRVLSDQEIQSLFAAGSGG